MKLSTIKIQIILILIVLGVAATVYAKVPKKVKKEFLPYVEEGLLSEVPAVKALSYLAVGELADKKKAKLLVTALKEETSPVIRQAALTGLLIMGNKTGTKTLVSEFEGGTPNSRKILLLEVVQKLSGKNQVKVLGTLLKTKKPELQTEILNYIARFGEDNAYSILIGYSKIKKTELQEKYLAAVFKYPRPLAMPIVEKLLANKKNSDHRLKGVRLAILINDTKKVKLLQKALSDEDPKVKEVAFEHLVSLRDPSIVPELSLEISSQNSEEQLNALRLLKEMKVSSLSKECLNMLKTRELDDITKGLLYELIGMSKTAEAMTFLSEEFASTYLERRVLAVKGLGYTDSKEAFKILNKALFDGNIKIRREAAKALGHLGMAEAIPGLQNAMNDVDPEVRLNVIEALGYTKDEQAVNVLQFLVTDFDPKVKLLSIEALRFLGFQSATETIELLLTDSDDSVRWKAALTLYLIKPDSYMDTFVGAYKTTPREITILDMDLLDKSQQSELTLRLMRDPNENVRDETLKEILRMEERGLPILRKMTGKAFEPKLRLRAYTELVTYAQKKDTPLFKALLQSSDKKIRLMALFTLAQYNAPELEEEFRAFLTSEDSVEKMSAMWAILRIYR